MNLGKTLGVLLGTYLLLDKRFHGSIYKAKLKECKQKLLEEINEIRFGDFDVEGEQTWAYNNLWKSSLTLSELTDAVCLRMRSEVTAKWLAQEHAKDKVGFANSFTRAFELIACPHRLFGEYDSREVLCTNVEGKCHAESESISLREMYMLFEQFDVEHREYLEDQLPGQTMAEFFKKKLKKDQTTGGKDE